MRFLNIFSRSSRSMALGNHFAPLRSHLLPRSLSSSVASSSFSPRVALPTHVCLSGCTCRGRGLVLGKRSFSSAASSAPKGLKEWLKSSPKSGESKSITEVILGRPEEPLYHLSHKILAVTGVYILGGVFVSLPALLLADLAFIPAAALHMIIGMDRVIADYVPAALQRLLSLGLVVVVLLATLGLFKMALFGPGLSDHLKAFFRAPQPKQIPTSHEKSK